MLKKHLCQISETHQILQLMDKNRGFLNVILIFFISNQGVLYIHTYVSSVTFGYRYSNDFSLKSINFKRFFVDFSAKLFISRFHGNGHA